MASRLNLGNAQKQRRDSAKPAGRPSAFVDTPVVYCGDNLEQRGKLPDACVDLIYIDPPFNSNRNYEVFWGETKEMRAFEDRHESTQAYIESSSSDEENLRGGLSRERREGTTFSILRGEPELNYADVQPGERVQGMQKWVRGTSQHEQNVVRAEGLEPSWAV